LSTKVIFSNFFEIILFLFKAESTSNCWQIFVTSLNWKESISNRRKILSCAKLITVQEFQW
jgi:hypothetical protein